MLYSELEKLALVGHNESYEAYINEYLILNLRLKDFFTLSSLLIIKAILP